MLNDNLKIFKFSSRPGVGFITQLLESFQSENNGNVEIVDVRASQLHPYDIKVLLEDTEETAESMPEKKYLLVFDDIISDDLVERIQFYAKNIVKQDNISIYIIKLELA